jgi:hypothetical protein
MNEAAAGINQIGGLSLWGSIAFFGALAVQSLTMVVALSSAKNHLPMGYPCLFELLAQGLESHARRRVPRAPTH